LTDTALTDIALPAVVPLRPGPVGPALVVGAPLGRLTSAQGVLLADIAEPGTEVRLTPWRSVVVPDGAAAAAACAAAGLIVSPDHALASITACSGLGECARALADVRADALAAAPLGRAAHWSACERRCGQPADALSIVAAGPASYRMGDDPQLRGPRDLGGEKS
jgi:precorrin-3B synthase